MATRLITKAKASALLQIALGIEEAEFNKFIDEAQKFDFKELVCDQFYADLLAKKDVAEWKKLIDGGTYTVDGRTYEFTGFDAVISYFAYSRMVVNGPIVSTSHGMVTKTTPYSEPVPLEERRNIYYKKREEANKLMSDVVKFIELNLDTYDSWNCSNSCEPKRKTGFSTTVIK